MEKKRLGHIAVLQICSGEAPVLSAQPVAKAEAVRLYKRTGNTSSWPCGLARWEKKVACRLGMSPRTLQLKPLAEGIGNIQTAMQTFQCVIYVSQFLHHLIVCYTTGDKLP